MAYVVFNAEDISDWDSFHKKSKETFGFPDFYGMNLNAWIDCLTYLRDGDGMSKFHLAENEKLQIEVTSTNRFFKRFPEIFGAFVECVAAVNFRNYLPVISVIFTDKS
jgi:hypothetical protein